MPNTNPINVLIVDDNKNNLFTLHTLIKEYLDVQILEADCGLGALKVLTKEPVDLIILDVQMPNMDGFETAQAIHSRKKTQHIPIVFLTAAYQAEKFQQKGFAIGAVDYLTKPIDPPQLISRIQSYVRFLEQDRQHKQELAQKVAERTAKLLEANQLQEQEIADRKKIEAALNHEIIERQQIEESINHEKEVAVAANLAKSHFLAQTSHEFRTPLNAIIGYTEMLTEDAEELGQDNCIPDLHKIHASSRHLLGLINNVLDLSKIEAGKMELFIERVDLDILVHEVIGTVQPLVAKKANTLKVERPDALGEMQTDMTKLRQILLNLLSNAAKFTENGIIGFKVAHQIRANGEWMVFKVVDEGIGMTDGQQKKLFNPYTQAEISTARHYGGTGLGLSITKQFTELMGGTIEVSSHYGLGSTFTLSLPTQARIAPVAIPEEETPVLESHGIILVIDDDARVREQLKNDLSQLGYAVVIAVNGPDGIKLANKHDPDAIVLDAQLSEIDGWRILAMLKNDALLAHIPVIFITRADEQQEGLARGAIECIDKTMLPSQLAAILKKYQIGDSIR